ncbi:MAG TPA: CoF synthetase [Xanthobacteraceae bacterium]|nr:CoF synthetase [Xanthobacteraceae bacterium]
MKHFLDVARGSYSHLPARTRFTLARFLRFVPENLKWGPSYRRWRELIAAARSDPALVRKHQDRARLAMVTAAEERSRYYRASLRDVFGAGLSPEQLLDHANWTRIPILAPATILEHVREMCTRPVEELDVASTGGTSGKPVKFYLDRHRSPIEYAFVHEAWSHAGFRPGDPRCVFRSVALDDADATHMQYDPALAELRCSVFHLTDATMRGYHDEIIARGIRFIHGYPSAIAIFASFLARSGLMPLSQIDGVFPTSERFDASQCEIVRQVFDRARLVPFYGLSEKVAFAWARDEDPDLFAFDPLYGYTELVDANGAAVATPGACGRIVSTGLLFPGMPLIRYETGDKAQLVALPDATNGYRLTVRGIAPKHDTLYLLGRSGVLIAVKGIISNLQGTAHGIREYQFYQDTPGEATVRIVSAAGAAADFSNYRDLLNCKMAGELRMAVELVDRIPLSPRGKRKLVEQRLDLAGALGKIQVRPIKVNAEA